MTLAEIAARYERTARSVQTHWLRYPDFPAPLGLRPRAGGGRGRLPAEYDQDAVKAFLTRHPELLPPAPIRYDGDLAGELTLSEFAHQATHADGRPLDPKSVYQCRDQPGFPAPVAETRYRAGEVLAFMNARPGSGNRLRGEARTSRDRRLRVEGAPPDRDPRVTGMTSSADTETAPGGQAQE